MRTTNGRLVQFIIELNCLSRTQWLLTLMKAMPKFLVAWLAPSGVLVGAARRLPSCGTRDHPSGTWLRVQNSTDLFYLCPTTIQSLRRRSKSRSTILLISNHSRTQTPIFKTYHVIRTFGTVP
jgi:hypothetical protein